jgi:hypothetical protein
VVSKANEWIGQASKRMKDCRMADECVGCVGCRASVGLNEIRLEEKR